MAFSVKDGDDDMMSEINMIPLIDVMLVLLIVFIVTIPVIKHSVNVDWPKASSDPVDIQTESVTVSIAKNGAYTLDNDETVLTLEQLQSKLQELGNIQPKPPALHIQADNAVDYEHVAKLMAAAAKAGLSNMGFVTAPDTASQ